MTVLKKEQSLYAIPEGVDPELLMKGVLGNPEMAALRTSLAKTMFTITSIYINSTNKIMELLKYPSG